MSSNSNKLDAFSDNLLHSPRSGESRTILRYDNQKFNTGATSSNKQHLEERQFASQNRTKRPTERPGSAVGPRSGVIGQRRSKPHYDSSEDESEESELVDLNDDDYQNLSQKSYIQQQDRKTPHRSSGISVPEIRYRHSHDDNAQFSDEEGFDDLNSQPSRVANRVLQRYRSRALSDGAQLKETVKLKRQEILGSKKAVKLEPLRAGMQHLSTSEELNIHWPKFKSSLQSLGSDQEGDEKSKSASLQKLNSSLNLSSELLTTEKLKGRLSPISPNNSVHK